MTRKGLLIILDGLGDQPVPALGNRTPLEAAYTPHLDRVANQAACSLVDTTVPGLPVATEVGVAVLLGLGRDEAKNVVRGPIEAAGVGVALMPGDLAIHANFATLRDEADGRIKVLDRRAGRIREGTLELAAAASGLDLGDGIRADVHPASQHRVVVRFTGPGLSADVSDTDPGAASDTMLVNPCIGHEATARAVNRFVALAREKLGNHAVNRDRRARGLPEANGLITRSAGVATKWEGRVRGAVDRAALVAAERTVIGMGRLLGYHAFVDARFTALPDTDLEAKREVARHALKNHDLVVLHIKGTDICAHEKDADGKRRFIERVDEMMAPLFETDHVIAVTADHGTSSLTGVHIPDPVPALLRIPGETAPGCHMFSETSCCGTGVQTAEQFLDTLLAALR
ncbi:MAG: alkaline phosphatase family protein [Planctomycetota bacterium]|nr:alkaline phosphatase family protein [Planctomycetota bacterium]